MSSLREKAAEKAKEYVKKDNKSLIYRLFNNPNRDKLKKMGQLPNKKKKDQ